MAPRITIIGGGSNQWAPTLVTDIARLELLQSAEIVLEDIDGSRLPRMEAYVRHLAKLLDIPLTVRSTTNQREALEGADFVVVNISTGGFASMRHDIEIPKRYGIFQSVGDTVGPGGILRGLRNVPVLVGIAKDMEQLCPDAWMLNLTNPMTTLCRGVTKETSIKTIGLCHELTMMQFFLSLLLDVSFLDLKATICGVNHLPVITAVDAAGKDGLAMLADLLDAGDQDAPLPFDMPDDIGHEPLAEGEVWTKAKLLDMMRIKMELFRRTGALPAAGDRHVAEFFPGFLTEASGYGKRWGVHLTEISQREAHEAKYSADLDAKLASTEIDEMPSGEMVHTVMWALLTGLPVELPLNIPNAGQCPDLPNGVVVESVCVVGPGNSVRGRDAATAPPLLASQLRQVSASQEMVVEAAMTGDRNMVVSAMLADPLAGRIDYDQVTQMADEMIEATKAWLPQFS